MGLKKDLIRSFLGVGAMRFLSIPLGLATSIILARTLGPDAFGRYAFAMALVPLLSLPVAGGVPQLLTREVAGYSYFANWSYYRGVVRSAHGWVIAISTLVLSLFFLLNAFGALPVNSPKWALVSIAILLVPIQGLNGVRTGTIKGLGFSAFSELPTQLIQPTILFLALGGLALSGTLNTQMAIWTQVCCGAFTFVVASFLFVKVRPQSSKKHRPDYEAGKWFSALLPFTLIALMSTFNNQVGILLLGAMGTDDAVAAMRVAERCAQFIGLPLTLVNMVISPHIVQAYRSDSLPRLKLLARKSSRAAFALALPAGCILFIWGQSLIELAFGFEYSSISYIPLVILCVGQLFNVFCGSVGYLLSLSGFEKDTLIGQSVSLIVSGAVCLIFIPIWGAIGAAFGISVGLVVWNILLLRQVIKRLGFRSSAL